VCSIQSLQINCEMRQARVANPEEEEGEEKKEE
jgi:hypothetical protein